MIATKFNVGDEVLVIASFEDTRALHFASEMADEINNKVVRKVRAIHNLNDNTLGYSLEGGWTWREECLQFAYDLADPYSKVIRKIKTLQTIRKEKGYAF